MANYSRDSFLATNNTLTELLGLVPPGAPGARNYVSVRLQQAVPVLDADWNEEGDIRRRELELMLVHAIGNGVPAQSDGFNIGDASLPNNFSIQAGIIFMNGWVVYSRGLVNYDAQPYASSQGVAPPLGVIVAPAQAGTSLVYLDAWEAEVSVQEDPKLVDPRIGVETCVRLERLWVVRMEPLAAGANPTDPASIPNQQTGHRYYPLASVSRPAGSQISAGMINDLRRTQLTLDSLTHAPLRMYDPVRDQHLDSARLSDVFLANLNALFDVVQLCPEVFVYNTNPVATAQAMTALQDTRAWAIGYHQQAHAGALDRNAALEAMSKFFDAQNNLLRTITKFFTSGLATGFTETFLAIYNANLLGASATDPTSLLFAKFSNDLIGTVLAQERLNQALGDQNNSLPEGTVALSLISATPDTAMVAGTLYQLTVRIQNSLASTVGSESIEVIASAGIGWALAFQGTGSADIAFAVTNQKTLDVVLDITPSVGAAATSLSLTARPVRRQQLVYQIQPLPLALGQPVLPVSSPIATLTYQGPGLQPGNIASVPRASIFGGVSLPFNVVNLSTTVETYQLTVVAQGTATDWQAPAQPVLAPLNGGANRTISVLFKTTDQINAVTPVTYQVELLRVTGGVNQPQANTIFNLTFQLT